MAVYKYSTWQTGAARSATEHIQHVWKKNSLLENAIEVDLQHDKC